MDMSEEPFCVEISRKKGTGTGHRNHFMASGDHVFDGSGGTCYKSHFVWKFKGKVPDPDSRDSILCGNLQEKWTWRRHKSHFVWTFTGKMREATFQARILCGNLQEKTPMDSAQEPFCVDIYRKNAGPPGAHLDQTRALFTLTVRTPSVWPHCLGKELHTMMWGKIQHCGQSVFKASHYSHANCIDFYVVTFDYAGSKLL